MNGFPVAFYTYNGTLTGDSDPWNQPAPAKRAYTRSEPKPPKQLKPCGTRAGYERHLAHDETPCQPCREARRAFDRERYQTRKAARKPRRKGRPPLTPEQTEHAKTRRREREQERRADPQWRAQEAEKARARYADPEYRAKRRAAERARYWRKKEEGK